MCLHKFYKLWNLFSLVLMGNCFRCSFRKLFVYLALRKCENDCKVLKIVLVPDFCRLKPEIARFSISFRLETHSNCFVALVTDRLKHVVNGHLFGSH